MKNDKRSIGCDPHIAPGVYYIQEELCARINGDRIIVEKKEGEDERIRKELLEYFNQFENKCLRGVDITPWIAYLEKQKERIKWPHVEQISEEENLCLMPQEQKPAEWSEEDEIGLADALDCVEKARKVAKDENDMGNCWYAEKWLKSLHPQLKQDVSPSLSEKEIICLKRALDHLRKEHNRYSGEDFTNEIVVLEWLITHPVLAQQPHWKPSEEQMEALNKVIHEVEMPLSIKTKLILFEDELKQL